MLANATRICAANFGNLLLYEGEVFRRVALHNAPQTWLTLTNVTKSYLAALHLFLIVLPTQRRQSISSILRRNIQASQSLNLQVLELFCWFRCSRRES